MMTRLVLLLPAALAAGPAAASSGPFLSLHNTNFVVLIAFLVFVGFLLYMKVPSLLGGLLDKRAVAIRAELDEARNLREEAKSILASFERRQREAQEQVERIVSAARDEAGAATEKARADLATSIARRLAAAEDSIAAAEASAVREVRERAASVAVAAAGEVLAGQATAASRRASVTTAIEEVTSRLARLN